MRTCMLLDQELTFFGPEIFDKVFLVGHVGTGTNRGNKGFQVGRYRIPTGTEASSVADQKCRIVSNMPVVQC